MNTKIFILALLLISTLFISVLADNKQDGIDFLNKIASEPGVIKHESGFYYKVNEPGTGKTHPSATSKVTVHYEGTLIDGTVFDSSYQRGETISFGLNQVIKCWTQGVQLMTVGAEHILYCPYELAYGAQSVSIIKPYSALVFKVKLFKIDGKDEL